MASIFTTLYVNTGAVGAGGDYDFDMAIPQNAVNLGKVKIIPSGGVLGYYYQIFKQASRLIGVSSSLQLATKNPTVGNCYIPTDRNGNEMLQGWVIPYEDLDGGLNIHNRIHNLDAVPRSYDVYVDYALIGVTTANLITAESLTAISATQNLANTPVTGTVKIYRGGLRQFAGVVSVVGTVVILATPLMAGEECIAEYIKA